MTDQGTSATPRAAGVVVRLRGVSRRFGQVAALDAVSLEVAAGSFCVLLGPSGCGKTTCLRIVAGLEQSSDGTVETLVSVSFVPPSCCC